MIVYKIQKNWSSCAKKKKCAVDYFWSRLCMREREREREFFSWISWNIRNVCMSVCVYIAVYDSFFINFYIVYLLEKNTWTAREWERESCTFPWCCRHSILSVYFLFDYNFIGLPEIGVKGVINAHNFKIIKNQHLIHTHKKKKKTDRYADKILATLFLLLRSCVGRQFTSSH